MPLSIRCRILSLLLVLTLAACGGTDAVPPTSEEDAVPDTSDAIPSTGDTPVPVVDLPEAKQDTILLEGMPEPITLELYRTPATFDLPFNTYHPADLMPETIQPAEGQTIRFVANFGGVRTEEAFVEFFVYPPGNTLQTVREQLEGIAEGVTRVPEADRRYAWSEEEYAFTEGDLVGRYLVGEHGGSYFRVSMVYPIEMGDGFPPRANILLEQLRWLDDASGLN